MSLRSHVVSAAALLCVLVAGGRAEAQSDPFQSVQYASSLTPISGGTVVPWQNFAGNQSESWLTVPLGFSFTWQGNAYTDVDISSNGGLSFSRNCGSQPWQCLGFNPSISPNFGEPQNFIVAWWAYHLIDPANGGEVRYETTGQPGGRTFTLQFVNVAENDWQIVANPRFYSFQIKLFEGSNLVQLVYGAIGAGADVVNLAGGAAAENALGSAGAVFLPCGLNCTESEFPADQTIQIGIPNEPDLTGTARLGPVQINGADMAFTVFADVRNLGLADASPVTWDAYLSANRTIDPATDLYLGTFAGPGVVAGQTAESFSIDVVTPRPANGSYSVGFILDPTNLILEATEGNNVGIIAEPFLVGADLVGSISAPAVSGPGEQLPLDLTFRNRGSDPTGPFRYRVWLSEDATIDPRDVLILDATRSLAGVQTVTGTELGTVPGGIVPGRSYAPILELDVDGAVAEASEANNLSQGTPVSIIGANLKLVEVDVRSPSLDVYYGTEVDVNVRVRNDGGATARGFVVQTVLSDNAVITINDRDLDSSPTTCSTDADCAGEWAGACEDFGCVPACSRDSECPAHTRCDRGGCRNVLAPGETFDYLVRVTLPTSNFEGVLLPDGPCFVGAIADAADSILENSENDNLRRAPQELLCRHPSPDFLATALVLPERGATGEELTVFRTVRNGGNARGIVTYRYYLSSNDVITVADLPLEIVGQGLTGSAELPAFAESQAADRLVLPANLAAGPYRVGLLVDPDGGIAELDEANNLFLASGTLQVSSGDLGVATGTLPDAVIGLRYVQQLRARGGDGAYSFALVGGQLPPGLAVAADGTIAGTPTTVGTWTIDVAVTSGSATDRARLALRVLPAGGPLAVSSRVLPPAFVNVAFQAPLAAMGGVQPYTWRLAGGVLPGGLRLLPAGAIDGTCALASESDVTVEVRDGAANAARAELHVRCVAPGTLVILTSRLADGFAGDFYDETISADGGDPLTYAWSVVGGELPPGLALERSSTRARLTGTPTQAGVYTLPVRVEDGDGNSDQVELVLTVLPKRLGLEVDVTLPIAHGGVAYPETRLAVANGAGALSFAVVGGRLPEGITLSRDGALAGTPPADVLPGVYDFLAQVSDAEGGLGSGAFAIEVAAKPIELPSNELGERLDDGGCGGCGASGSGPSGLALLGLGLALAARRPRRRAPALRALPIVVAAVLLLPQLARAQYGVVPGGAPYAALGNSATLVCGQFGSCTGASVPVELPFPFRFYGVEYDALLASSEGALSFTAVGTIPASNDALPSAAAPNALIAPWWDDLGAQNNWGAVSTFRWEVQGAAPRRVVIFDWADFRHSNDMQTGSEDLYSFQVRLYETTMIAEVAYLVEGGGRDPSMNFSATTGIENADGTEGAAILPCGTQCGAQDFPPAATYRIVREPELRVSEVTGPETVFGGGRALLHATVRNDGGEPALLQSTAFYLSSDAFLSSDDVRLGGAPAVDVPGRGRAVSIELEVELPEVAGGPYYVIAAADDTSLVAEADEANNWLASEETIAVRRAAPNLVPRLVSVPAALPAGGEATVRVALRNDGVRAAASSPLVVVVSANPVATASDIPVGGADLGVIAVGDEREQDVTISIPGTLPLDAVPGGPVDGWFVAVIVDPLALVPETDELDNAAIGVGRVPVDGGALSIATSLLPDAAVGSPYGVQLRASGGGGALRWSARGLPAGLSIEEASGWLWGVPGSAGAATVTLEVTDGTTSAEATLPLLVSASSLPLTVTTRELPAAGFGASYELLLTAVGGCAPYTWRESTSPRALPAGLTIAADGLLSGQPRLDGSFAFEVEVRDACDVAVRQSLSLRVLPPGRLTLVSDPLPAAVVGVDYEERLHVAGGKAPYGWEVVQTKRLPLAAGDRGETLAGVPPPGLLLSTTGVLAGRPTAAGVFLLTVLATDADGAQDAATLQLTIRFEQGLAIVTGALPDAVAGDDYSVELLAAGGEGFLSWRIIDGQALPDGLELAPEGILEGSVVDSALDGEPERRFAFIAEVKDASNRVAVKALSIRVLAERPKPWVAPVQTVPEADPGCSTGGRGGAVGGLVVALALLLTRRRAAR